MKVILTTNIKKLGKIGQTVIVKPGYARNYLFPNEIATVASESNRKKLDSFLKAQELKEAKNRTNMELLFKQLNKVTLKFELESGEDDKLFGSVTSQMIIDALADLGYTIDKKEIIIDESIKTLGNHFIHINLDYELKAKVKVKVSSKK